MNYYIEKDNKIIFVDTHLQRLQNTVAIGEYANLEIKKTTRPIINFEFADVPEYIDREKKQAKKQIQEKYKKIMDEYVCAKVKQDLFTTAEYQSMITDMYAEIGAL